MMLDSHTYFMSFNVPQSYDFLQGIERFSGVAACTIITKNVSNNSVFRNRLFTINRSR